MADRDSESPEELEAREFFERGLHLNVSRVPGGDKETPDFLVDRDPPDYVVEVKTRFDDKDYLSELESGKVAVRDRLMGHDRWASDNARKALKQFQQVDNSH